MNKKEVYNLLRTVAMYYPNFIDLKKMDEVQLKIDAWYRALKDFDNDSVLDNLAAYSQENEFPPKVVSLTKGLFRDSSNDHILGVDETKELLKTYTVPKEQRLSKEQIRALVKEKLGEDFLK